MGGNVNKERLLMFPSSQDKEKSQHRKEVVCSTVWWREEEFGLLEVEILTGMVEGPLTQLKKTFLGFISVTYKIEFE